MVKNVRGRMKAYGSDEEIFTELAELIVFLADVFNKEIIELGEVLIHAALKIQREQYGNKQ